MGLRWVGGEIGVRMIGRLLKVVDANRSSRSEAVALVLSCDSPSWMAWEWVRGSRHDAEGEILVSDALANGQ